MNDSFYKTAHVQFLVISSIDRVVPYVVLGHFLQIRRVGRLLTLLFQTVDDARCREAYNKKDGGEDDEGDEDDERLLWL